MLRKYPNCERCWVEGGDGEDPPAEAVSCRVMVEEMAGPERRWVAASRAKEKEGEDIVQGLKYKKWLQRQHWRGLRALGEEGL